MCVTLRLGEKGEGLGGGGGVIDSASFKVGGPGSIIYHGWEVDTWIYPTRGRRSRRLCGNFVEIRH